MTVLASAQVAPPAVQIPQAGVVVIDFEHATTVGKGQGGPVVLTGGLSAHGVRFNRVFVFDYTKGLALAGFAHSGTRAIEQCYALEFCSEPIEATFNTLQARVKVWVGYSARHDAGSILLIALDEAGRTIDRRVVTVPASASPAPIDQSMEIAFPEPRIQSIRVIAQGGLGASGLAVDDLEFDNSIPSNTPPADQPPADTGPPRPTPDFALGEPRFDHDGGRRPRIEIPVIVLGAGAGPTTIVATSTAWQGPITSAVPQANPGTYAMTVMVPTGIPPGNYNVDLSINQPAVQPEVTFANNSASLVISVPRTGSGSMWYLVVGLVVLGVGVAVVLRLRKQVSPKGPVPQVTFRPHPAAGRPRLVRDPRRKGDFAIRLRAHPGRWSSRVSVRNSGKVSP
jgi:LPXTG-motif cell wall-anchored protein